MFKRAMRQFIMFFVHIVNRVYRVKYIDTEKLPKEGPAIIAINHRNYFDVFFVMALFKKEKPIFVGRRTVNNNPLGRFAAWAFDVILVERDGSDAGPLKNMLKVIKRKQMLGIFPEGTRNGLHKGRFASGTTYVALRTKTDIFPIGISGPLKPFSKGNQLKVGDKFNLYEMMDENKTTKDKDEIKRLNEILKNKILELTNDGFYDDLK